MQAKAKPGKYLMGKCQSEHYLQLSFQSFVKPFSISKLLSKVSQIQTTISGRTFKYYCVNVRLGVNVARGLMSCYDNCLRHPRHRRRLELCKMRTNSHYAISRRLSDPSSWVSQTVLINCFDMHQFNLLMLKRIKNDFSKCLKKSCW